jgi:gamma-glutamylcyclotransferase (GGCT)/AIG2-like uncharacterized protein YtfP
MIDERLWFDPHPGPLSNGERALPDSRSPICRDDGRMTAMNETPRAVFVYGTLKRGQCREQFWPRAPLAVETALVRGRLVDLGPYPALLPGDRWIRGELWRFADEDMSETLRVLDEVEGYAGLGEDLYRRVVITCHTTEGAEVAAYAYQFAQPQRAGQAIEVLPGADGVCCWSAAR